MTFGPPIREQFSVLGERSVWREVSRLVDNIGYVLEEIHPAQTA